jgi:hypothetical protein
MIISKANCECTPVSAIIHSHSSLSNSSPTVMFKKPLGSLKTSAPLRSSDRRRLKQRVVESFQTSSEDGDLLVPDGILSVKFSTHLNEPGVRYLRIHLLQCKMVYYV